MRTSTRLTLAAALATWLGALPLAGGFSEQRWIWPATLSIVVVAAVGLLTRSARVSPVVTVLAQLLGLLFAHTFVFTRSDAIAWFIPTGRSVGALRTAIQDGMTDIQYLAAPVPARQDLVILTALSVGLIAIVVDLIAVTFRRPAVSGLALLALFAVATAVSNGVPWLLFLAAGGGYLILLAVEGREHLVRWGRVISPGQGRSDPDGHSVPRHSAAGRIGMTALALALIVPLLVPGFSRNLLQNIGSSSGSGHSGRTGRSIDPFTTLRGELQQPGAEELLRVRTSSTPRYLRTSVLGEYTAQGWRTGPDQSHESKAAGNLPVPDQVARLANAGSARSVQASITIDRYNGTDLPTYYVPTQVGGLGKDWHYVSGEAEIRGDHALAQGTTYTMNVVEPHPSRADLNASTTVARNDPVMRQWGQVPASVRPEVKQITHNVIKGAGTPWSRAVALNNYFRDGTHGFSYSLQTRDGGSSDGLLNFLRTKTGYCEQYASAMGIMLRIAGIPSRVVLGYTPGVQEPDGSWKVTNHDAHAWVEAYFNKLGWVQFDPTPLSDGRGATQAFISGTDEPSTSPTTAPTTGDQRVQPRTAPQQTSGAGISAAHGGGPGGSGSGGSTTPAVLGGILTVVAVLLLLLVPAGLRRAGRRSRLAIAAGPDPGAAAHAAWSEVLATAVDHRIRLPRHESPRATAARLLTAREDLPAAAGSALSLVALAEERARYAREAGVDGDLPTAVAAIRRGLSSTASRRDRLRIAIAPASVAVATRTRTREAKARLQAGVRSLVRIVTPWRGAGST